MTLAPPPLATRPSAAAVVAGTQLSVALAASAARHGRLCPRQVLGVRIGLAGASALELTLPRRDKRLLAIVESDGCFADGVEAATGCSLGHRTLRLEDEGKVAVTFVDLKTGGAVRVAPRSGVRARAAAYAAGETRRYYAQLRGYRLMPDAELLALTPVCLTWDLDALVGRPGVRVECTICGEEIMNGRERLVDGGARCRSCAGACYYAAVSSTAP